MIIKSPVGSLEQLPIKPLFTDAGFVPGNQKNGLASGVKGKGNAPDTVRRIDPQFLHVRVAGPVECIDVGPAKQRTYDFERTGKGTDFILHVFRQRVKLRIEILRELNALLHPHSMALQSYDVDTISSSAKGRL
jgi:hypothetical protein